MSFLRNCWQVVAYGREVIAGRIMTRRVANEPLILFRTARGKLVAMEDRCPRRRRFDEDKDMLEAQQANLGSGDFDPAYKVAVKADAGAVAGRRLLNAFIEAEARAVAA